MLLTRFYYYNKRLFIFSLLILLVINCLNAQIQTTNPIKTKYCVGTSVSISFTSSNTFNSGNVFSVEMSDANGSFTSPTIVGSRTGTNIAAVNCMIPSQTINGTGYRFRVNSSDPLLTGTENSTDIELVVKSIPFAGFDDTICAGQAFTIHSASTQFADSAKWTSSGTGSFDDIRSLTTTFHPSKADSTSGKTNLYLTSYNSCGSVKDTMKLSLFRAPTLNLGRDTLACINDTLNLDYYTATNYYGFNWTGNGTGSFLTPNSKNPQYVSSVDDGAKDSIVLYCTLNSVCGQKKDTIIIRVKDVPYLTVSPDIISCRGVETIITADGAETYTWDNGVNTASFAVAPESTRLYTVTASTFCASSIDSVLVTIWPTPVLETSNDTTIDYMFPASLWATGGYTYDWTPSNGLSTTEGPTTTANPEFDTWYYVTAWDSLHVCDVTDSIKVSVYHRDYDIWLPNAFTPNKGAGDGENDLFRPLPLGLFGLKNFKMEIYNRYGVSVFQTSDCIKGWNGIDLKTNIPYDVGTYLYHVSATDPYGNVIIKTGSVVLLK